MGKDRLTASIASFTRELLIRPLLKRLVMRSLFVAPELRQAMLVYEVKPRVRPLLRVERVRMDVKYPRRGLLSYDHGCIWVCFERGG